MINGKLIKNSIVALLSIAVLIRGYLTLLYFSSENIEGYAGYCNYIEMPFANVAKNVEVVFLTLFLIFVISLVAYERVRNLTHNKANIILSISLLNLCFIAYQIIKYPRVLSYINWGFYPDNTPRNDQHLGLDYHPLIMVFLIYSLSIIWYNCILKKNEIENYYKITNWIILGLLTIVGLIVIANIEYEMCAG